jgi:hypothetical protein
MKRSYGIKHKLGQLQAQFASWRQNYAFWIFAGQVFTSSRKRKKEHELTKEIYIYLKFKYTFSSALK